MIISELALMSDEAFERYLARHRITGMAATNLSSKRRKARRELASFDPAVQAAATLSRAALTEAAKEAVALNSGGIVPGIVFAVSNDGGKTGVAWRENVFEALAYLDLQNKAGGDYAVVAVRKRA